MRGKDILAKFVLPPHSAAELDETSAAAMLGCIADTGVFYSSDGGPIRESLDPEEETGLGADGLLRRLVAS